MQESDRGRVRSYSWKIKGAIALISSVDQMQESDRDRVRSHSWKIKGAIDRLSIGYSNCLPLTAFQPF